MTFISIPCEVNGHKVVAFVDSGAQQTISEFSIIAFTLFRTAFLVSPEYADKCG
jgi:hypothetical protein